MIIYQDTKAVFLDDIANNYFAARLEDAFLKKTGSLPSDSRGWANDYARFSSVLGQADVADDISVAIEYHCSPVGRSRIDVLLAGSDGQTDNGLIIELKAWDTASATDIENMVLSPIGGGTVKQHPNLQARQYQGMILRFNEDILREGIRLHPSAYLFNLYRRDPEPLEDARKERRPLPPRAREMEAYGRADQSRGEHARRQRRVHLDRRAGRGLPHHPPSGPLRGGPFPPPRLRGRGLGGMH